MRDNVTVFVKEEYGYRYWTWESGMSAGALVAWWKALPSVSEYFFTPEGLPGKMTLISLDMEEAEEADDIWAAFEHKVKEEKEKCNGWKVHVHLDDDSWLKTPDGETHHHAGYCNSEEE